MLIGVSGSGDTAGPLQGPLTRTYSRVGRFGVLERCSKMTLLHLQGIVRLKQSNWTQIFISPHNLAGTWNLQKAARGQFFTFTPKGLRLLFFMDVHTSRLSIL